MSTTPDGDNKNLGPVWKWICAIQAAVLITGVTSWLTFGIDKVSRNELKDAVNVFREATNHRFTEADKSRDYMHNDLKATNTELRNLAERMSDLVGYLKGRELLERERGK
jgi:hypothetical protein